MSLIGAIQKCSCLKAVAAGATLAVCLSLGMLAAGASPAAGVPCQLPDNGSGTVFLPPDGCGYLSPQDVHVIIDGLPAGTTIEVAAQHTKFFNVTRTPGGAHGGEVEVFDSLLFMDMTGTGSLAGFNRSVALPIQCEIDTGPRTPGDSVQTFVAEMMKLEGGITGDPDFAQLNVLGGTDNGLPGPGQTTLTRLGPPGSDFNVDSFFDIEYRIDFVGATGSVLGGYGGTTQSTVHMTSGEPLTSTGACCYSASGGGCLIQTQAECDAGGGLYIADDVPCQPDPCPPPPEPCTVVDNGTGTIDLPPRSCDYISPSDLHMMFDGLPPGTEIHVTAQDGRFVNVSTMPGGSLGGEIESFDSSLILRLIGSGELLGYYRVLTIPIHCEVHSAPRNPGDPIQDFDTDMFMLQGELSGDPDFDLLALTGGDSFDLPSPGHTTLTRLPSGDFSVDSFFDIEYRIEFQGAPGSALDGLGGATQTQAHMGTGTPHDPVGACCISAAGSGGCSIQTQADCEELGGVYIADGVPCDPDPCPFPPVQCTEPDNGTGTIDLPPQSCDFISPTELQLMIEGLPPETGIHVAARSGQFTDIMRMPGGSLGGEIETFNSVLELNMTGTGDLSGFHRVLSLPIGLEVDTGPTSPGDAVQSFPHDLVQLQGQLFGDPDFDELTMVAGSGNGLPSPGHTTLTRLGSPGSDFQVDSFFDIEYDISFQGAAGSALDGLSGSTTGTLRVQTGAGAGNPGACCDPATGSCSIQTRADCDLAGGLYIADDVPCSPNPCPEPQGPCEVVDNGTGTVDLPPDGCGYVSPADLHMIIEGLPPGTEIHVAANHSKFFNIQTSPGGTLGGEVEQFDSILQLKMTGSGDLLGFNRFMTVPVHCEVHTAPRTPGDPVQDFDSDMFMLQGALQGDPDFELLQLTGGDDFGLPSPGHTTLTQLPNGNFNVDSFFDIEYRIDFQGAPGSVLEGLGGVTQDQVHMGSGVSHDPVGACCLPGGAAGCVILTEQECLDQGGFYLGDGVPCDPTICQTLEACCFPDGTCQLFPPADCQAAGGTYHGGPCDPNPCPGGPCVIPDNGTGTADLPPDGCGYVSPNDLHMMIDGLPAGTEIHLAADHTRFFNVERTPGGTLGGEIEIFDSELHLHLQGTGELGDYQRDLIVPVACEVHTGPRTPGDPIQQFPNAMMKLQGGLTGDPDFETLQFTAGDDFGMPSPGQTTLSLVGGTTVVPGATNWNVDSFFDIEYEIDFVGAPGGPLDGLSGSTTRTIRMQTGQAAASTPDVTPPVEVGTLKVQPNPFGLDTTLSFALQAAGRVDLQVFDVAGRVVRKLVSGGLEAGPHSVVWDGRDDSGAPVRTGTYFYKLRVDGREVATEKGLLVK